MTRSSCINTHPSLFLDASLYTTKSLPLVGKASMSALVNLFLSFWKASSQRSVHSHLVTFLVKLVSGVAIFEKSRTNLRWYPVGPKRLLTSVAFLGLGQFVTASIFYGFADTPS